MMMATTRKPSTAEFGSATDLLPVIDLWQRRTANRVVITGSFASVKLILYQIVDAPEDGPHWRLYFAPRQQAIERDRAQPTTATA
jgi:hypothetical protein